MRRRYPIVQPDGLDRAHPTASAVSRAASAQHLVRLLVARAFAGTTGLNTSLHRRAVAAIVLCCSKVLNRTVRPANELIRLPCRFYRSHPFG